MGDSKLVATVLIFIGTLAPAWGQDSNLLLGVPFGGRLQLSRCPPNAESSARPCWIDRPFLYKPTGANSGYVHLPGSDARPKWAAHAMFQLTLDKTGTVQEVKVNTFDAKERHQIADSISRRFGTPIENNLFREDISWASWRSAEGSVALRCQRECWVEFRTPAAQEALGAELTARAKKDVARPSTP